MYSEIYLIYIKNYKECTRKKREILPKITHIIEKIRDESKI